MRTAFDLAKKKVKIEELEQQLQDPEVWKDTRKVAQIQQELNELKEEQRLITGFKKELQDLEEVSQLAEEDESLMAELNKKFFDLEKHIAKQELKVFLSGKYDRGSATLSIFAGAGGQDAQDWATMLLRMYERYCQQKGFQTKILNQTFGEPSPDGKIGIKSVTLEVKGEYAYGFLKGENGVHRLVRISPFSAQKLRHTSFALVEVLPEFSKDIEKEIEIRPEDLKIDFYRASGPGGQYVNRRETAVRITHLPTKIAVSCQSERLQGQNRARAMELLYAKLYQLKLQEKEQEITRLKGKRISIGWGNQIRSYVLHPYKMVKDLRTGVEISDAEGVLDGNLDKFIEAEIKTI